MSKSFSLDYNFLDTATTSKKTYKFADVKHKLVKVAFDVVKFNDSDELWQIQSADDGEYIVARYETEKEDEIAKTAAKKSSLWDAIASGTNVDVFYKGFPITKIAAKQLGLSALEVSAFLPNKLATDKVFVSALLSSLDKTAKETLLKSYPELGK
jgi:predicted ATP-dependent protease